MVTNVEIINNILVETTDENTTITKPFLLNVKEIEEQIESIEYTGVNRPRNSFVEKINFPPMALAFYNFLFQNGKIPTENEFMETYEDLFSQHIIFNYNRKSVDINYANRDTHIFWAEYYRGRLLRTYPSFIREIHFFCILKECGLFSNVRYSFKFDFEHNTDIIIEYNGKTYYLWLTLDTANALCGLMRKCRKLQYTPAVIIKMNLSRAQLCGRFKLFSLETLKDLRDCLDNDGRGCKYIEFIKSI